LQEIPVLGLVSGLFLASFITFMRNRPSATGRLLRSVALRYRQPNRRFAGEKVFGGHPTAFWSDAPGDSPPNVAGLNARDERLAQLEAVLFLSTQPLGSRKLAQLADLADGTKARTLVRKLNRLYDAEGSAFRVEEVAGGFQLLTRAKFAPWLRRMHSTSVEIRLSGPAMETLAVVAYRQPVLRAEIEAIRGVQSGEVLRQLIERDMVRIVGRSDDLGRPFLYGTGKRFLQVFGLRHLDELPQRELIQGGCGLSEVQPRLDEAAENDLIADVGAAGSLPASPAETAIDISKTPKQYQVPEEEKNVKTLTTKARSEFVAEDPTAALMERKRSASPERQGFFNQVEDEDEFEDEEDEDLEDEEFDDLDEDDDDEEEEDDDEDLEDDWEEVEDDDEDEEEDDEDEDWDDEDWDDEDWDDDDEEDDFDEDEDDDLDEDEDEAEEGED
jgi:segregation and condensation protein B